jgi:hypothetical protein
VKKLLAFILTVAFVAGLLGTMTGCPDNSKKTTTLTVTPTLTEKTKTTTP